MSAIKTITTSLTAAVLVTGIGLAWAQTDDQQPVQPAEATAAVAVPSEQTPADPNALPPVDNTTATQLQQQQQADDPSRMTPPADTTAAPMPSQTPAVQDNAPINSTPAVTPEPSYQPAPRADRN